MPRVSCARPETRTPLPQCRHRWVEHLRRPVYDSGGSELAELISRHGANASVPVAEKDEAAGYDCGAQLRFERLEGTKQSVNRTPRRAGASLVHGNCEEPVVAPVSGGTQGRPVSGPLS